MPEIYSCFSSVNLFILMCDSAFCLLDRVYLDLGRRLLFVYATPLGDQMARLCPKRIENGEKVGRKSL